MVARRALIVTGVVVLATSGTSAAEQSIELAVGVNQPLASDEWRESADTGFKVAGRGTSTTRGPRLVIGMEWARSSRDGFRRYDRFRLLLGPALETSFWGMGFSARATVGADVVAATTVTTEPTFGLPVEDREIEPGVGGEVAATLWFLRTGDLDVGVSVGLPIAVHWGDAQLEYFEIGLDGMAVLRLR